MSPRPPLLAAAFALGLLAGCSRNPPPPQPAESRGAPSSAPLEAPTADKAGQEQAGPAPQAGTAPGESPSDTTGAPAERGPAVFFVKNSGVRCMTHPCPTFVITRPDRPGEEPIQVHELDLSALNVDDEKRNQLELATFHEPGLKVEATLDTVRNAGPAGDATVLRVIKLAK
jgi:hypothetical protein